jgi:hypothetical protein
VSRERVGCFAGLARVSLILWVSHLGCVGTMVGLAVLVVLAVLAVTLFIKAIPLLLLLLRLLLGVGALFGLAITLRNYLQALRQNVKPERVAPP